MKIPTQARARAIACVAEGVSVADAARENGILRDTLHSIISRSRRPPRRVGRPKALNPEEANAVCGWAAAATSQSACSLRSLARRATTEFKRAVSISGVVTALSDHQRQLCEEPIFFEAGDDSHERLLQVIKSARKSLDLAVVLLTNPTIAKEIASAATRGVVVRILGDGKSDLQMAADSQLAWLGALKRVDVRVTSTKEKLNAAVALIDGVANFSDQLEISELFYKDARYSKFLRRFEELWERCAPEKRMEVERQLAAELSRRASEANARRGEEESLAFEHERSE